MVYLNQTFSFYRWQGDELLLDVRIQPGAKFNDIDGLYGHRLKIRIAAPAVDGKANKHLVMYLSRLFKVRKSMIKILSGETSRNKCVKIIAPLNLPGIITKAK